MRACDQFESQSQVYVGLYWGKVKWMMVDVCDLAHSFISCSDRARVVGGLPDVVAIQEGKVNS